jgi:hypothetical protein
MIGHQPEGRSQVVLTFFALSKGAILDGPLEIKLEGRGLGYFLSEFFNPALNTMMPPNRDRHEKASKEDQSTGAHH